MADIFVGFEKGYLTSVAGNFHWLLNGKNGSSSTYRERKLIVPLIEVLFYGGVSINAVGSVMHGPK